MFPWLWQGVASFSEVDAALERAEECSRAFGVGEELDFGSLGVAGQWWEFITD